MCQSIALSAEQLKDFTKGNETIFREIYVSYSPKVFRFAYSFLKERPHSEEIVQETFLSLWENREKFEEGKPLEPYLFTIAKRLILDQLRKNTSSAALRNKLLIAIAAQHNETEENIIFSDMLVLAEKAICELPQQQQVVFRLSRLEGLSYDEIAQRLNLSRNTVKNHLGVAVKKLRTSLNNQEVICLLFMWVYLFR